MASDDRDPQDVADQAEESSIQRLRRFRLARPDPWVRRLVAITLVGFYAFYIYATLAHLPGTVGNCQSIAALVLNHC